MELSNELISQFVKATNDNDTKTKTGVTVKGTTVEYNGKTYVKIDGSELLTPVNTTAATKPGDRVTVNIQDHTATVTGNLTSPSANDSDVQAMGSQISEFEIVIADKVSTGELNAQIARIDELRTENVSIKGRLTAGEAKIGDLEADNVTINKTLTANKASINDLETNKLSADVADITYATIKDLEAANADIYNLNATYATFKDTITEELTAIDADIENLNATRLTADSANLMYANIDFTNIGKAAMEYFYAQSGLIKDVVVGDQTLTGELVGVTIKGDLIEAGTLRADKLVIKGSDGNYYKLNTDFSGITNVEPVEEDMIHGSSIVTNSITAEKISVKDLVAFDATIGGFNITSDAIYSGVKETATNTTRGIYMDKEGQWSVGDAYNFLRYYKDQNGTYKLEISADSITMSTSEHTIEDEIADLRKNMTTIQDEVTTLLHIESSRGTVFKNDQVSTVLSAVIYRGSKRITDMKTLKSAMGNSVYLEWSWQRLNEDTYGVISADDSRIGNDGFTFTLSPSDVDTKVTFMCTLNV